MTKAHVTEEINRIARCIDFRFARDLRSNAEETIELLEFARALINRPAGAHDNRFFDKCLVKTLELALSKLWDLREDVDCIEAGQRRPFLQNVDDAEDSLQTILLLAQELKIRD